MINCIINH